MIGKPKENKVTQDLLLLEKSLLLFCNAWLKDNCNGLNPGDLVAFHTMTQNNERRMAEINEALKVLGVSERDIPISGLMI